MLTEWKEKSTVQPGGRVVITVPGLQAGIVVEVLVRFEAKERSIAPQRPLGLLKGKIRMREDFDAPLEEFVEYTR